MSDSDGGQQQQRVLDLIDDPHALESFLGGLTSESELLPSAESVDNVVASLARSLEADYEVDSPNETLFDTLEASSNNLTDISQSYVPSDFENAIANAGGMGSLSNGGEGNHQTIQQQQQTLHNSLSSIVTSGVDQFLMSSSTSQTNSIATLNSTSNLQQFTSNCDSTSSSSGTQFLQHHQIQMNQNQVLLDNSSSNNLTSYSFSQELLQKQSIVNNVNQQTQQITSLSSTSLSNQQSDSTSLNQSSISVSMPCNQNNNNNGQLTSHAFQQVSTNNSNLNASSNSITNNSLQNSTTPSNDLTCNNVTNISVNNSPTIIQAQPQHIQSSINQQATLNQLVSAGQTVSLANVNVGGAQLLATSTGSIMTAGQCQTQSNVIQQIQQAGGGQSFITVDQPTTALIAGAGGFGGTNLLLATGGSTPTYAVVNTGTQFLSNTIMTQPQSFQTLTKGPNGTYFQTTGGATHQLVTTSNVANVGQIQNVNVSVSSSPTPPSKPKQLLPKPQSGSSPAPTTVTEIENSTTSSTNLNAGSQQQNATSVTVSNSDGGVAQIFQQQQIQGHQVVVTSVGNTVIPQSFSIGGAGGIGQVVMSQNPNQHQLTGTIVVNQYGQPMLVPSAGQQGIQFIVRPQQQLLTLQTQPGQANNQNRPVVRYVSQMPQMAQTQGYGLQQIQTPNGPAWVAVRMPPTATLATSSGQQFSQIQTDSNIISSQTGQQQQIGQVQQQVVQQTTTPTPPQPVATPNPPQPTPKPNTPKQSTTPQPSKKTPVNPEPAPADSSSGPPPAKKSKSKPKANNKKKVTLDLEQLLKQSGIMDEDLQDDSFDFSFSSQDTAQNGIDGDFLQLSTESPTKTNSVQDPGVNSSVKAKSGGSKRKPSSGGGGVGGSSKKKKKRPLTPPPPPPPPTPKAKAKRNRGNQKADSKTDVVKNVSSIDSISATIDAVALGSPSPPSSPSSSLPLSSPAGASTPATPGGPMTPSSPAIPSSIKPSTPNVMVPPPTTPSPAPHNGINNNLPASVASFTSNSSPGTTRIVQTIQLTPQNQHLLRNIQAQISRLLSLPKRNDTEQTALQKLIVLQQQVIATGIPVPNPSHLNNLNSASTTIFPASTFTTPPVTGGGSTSASVGDLVATSTSASSTLTPTTNNFNSPATLSTSNSNVKILPKIAIPPVDEPNNDLSGSFIETMAKVGVVDSVSEVSSESNIGITEENKENATGSASNMVVSSSSFSSGTNTTNALGQHHVQSFPPTFRSTVDEKKADDQRLANFKVEEEKRTRWRKEEFEMLLKRDQQCVTQPDYEIPFTDKRDAVERLMKYHILRDRNDMNFEEFDNEFGEKAVVLLDKFNGMVSKYRSLLLKESMKEVGCAERVMLERMFVAEEKTKMEQDRQLTNQGEVLELPPPPPSWIPKIQEMVDKDMKEMEQDSYVNMQVQSAIDSIIGFGNIDQMNALTDELENKIEYDAFGVPINNNGVGFNNGMNTSSADIDEAVRSIMM